jgi:hypothetical protein
LIDAKTTLIAYPQHSDKKNKKIAFIAKKTKKFFYRFFDQV